MTDSTRFRTNAAEQQQLRDAAGAAGFGENVSAYIRQRLGLPAAERGRPWPKKSLAKAKAKPLRPRGTPPEPK